MKDVVEELNKTPGIIPVSKISDKASLFQDTVPKSSYLQAPTTESEDLRTLTELLNKVHKSENTYRDGGNCQAELDHRIQTDH